MVCFYFTLKGHFSVYEFSARENENLPGITDYSKSEFFECVAYPRLSYQTDLKNSQWKLDGQPPSVLSMCQEIQTDMNYKDRTNTLNSKELISKCLFKNQLVCLTLYRHFLVILTKSVKLCPCWDFKWFFNSWKNTNRHGTSIQNGHFGNRVN